MKGNAIASALVLAAASLYGCSTTPETERSSDTWQAYQAFQDELKNHPQAPDFNRHLSSDWIKLFDDADGEEAVQLKNYATYPAWLSSAHAHYEKPSGDGTCLSVNGIAFDQSPGTVSVRYVTEDGQLKASEIHYQYWESETEFPPEARCPGDFELDFPAS